MTRIDANFAQVPNSVKALAPHDGDMCGEPSREEESGAAQPARPSTAFSGILWIAVVAYTGGVLADFF